MEDGEMRALSARVAKAMRGESAEEEVVTLLAAVAQAYLAGAIVEDLERRLQDVVASGELNWGRDGLDDLEWAQVGGIVAAENFRRGWTPAPELIAAMLYASYPRSGVSDSDECSEILSTLDFASEGEFWFEDAEAIKQVLLAQARDAGINVPRCRATRWKPLSGLGAADGD
jgi:hypothetical protein